MPESTPRRRRRSAGRTTSPEATETALPDPSPATPHPTPSPATAADHTNPRPPRYTALYPVNRNGTVIPRGGAVEFAEDEAGHAHALAKVGVVMEGDSGDPRVRARIARLDEADRRRGL